MKKHRILPIILMATLMATLVLSGTVVAYMFKRTEYINNDFTPARVSCQVVENFNGEKKTSIVVQNTGNIDAYLRVMLVSYWVDGDGNIVAKPSPTLSISLGEGWIKGTNNIYYYESPVVPSEQTANLLTVPIMLVEEDGYSQVIEVFAEAIQSKPQDSVTSSWNVTLDSGGNIIATP